MLLKSIAKSIVHAAKRQSDSPPPQPTPPTPTPTPTPTSPYSGTSSFTPASQAPVTLTPMPNLTPSFTPSPVLVTPTPTGQAPRTGDACQPPGHVGPIHFNPRNPRDVLALAQQYAPIRYLHPDESYGPGDPQDFIDHSRVRQHLSGRPDRTLPGFGEGQIQSRQLSWLHADNLYMDLEDDVATRMGSGASSPTLYQYDQQSNTMTYWFFYPYNVAPVPGPFDHEGDWERVTIQFDAQQQPVEVRYSAHEGFITRSWDEAPQEDGRPVVYVGEGSHANSPVTGATPALAPGGVEIATDHFGVGQRVDGACHPFRDVTQEPWYGTSVHWGERGNLADAGAELTSGPSGPSDTKGPLLP